MINNGGSNNSSTGGAGPWDKGISTVRDMIKEMTVDFAPLEGIAPTPRNELAYNMNEVPKHKVSVVGAQKGRRRRRQLYCSFHANWIAVPFLLALVHFTQYTEPLFKAPPINSSSSSNNNHNTINNNNRSSSKHSDILDNDLNISDSDDGGAGEREKTKKAMASTTAVVGAAAAATGAIMAAVATA